MSKSAVAITFWQGDKPSNLHNKAPATAARRQHQDGLVEKQSKKIKRPRGPPRWVVLADDMIVPGQGGIRLTLLKNGAPRQQLCLRQALPVGLLASSSMRQLQMTFALGGPKGERSRAAGGGESDRSGLFADAKAS